MIEAAESVVDLLQHCRLSQVAQLADSSRYQINHIWARDIDQISKTKIFNIFEDNMKAMYLRTWGWNKTELLQEFFSSKSAYLLATDDAGVVIGYIHFQVAVVHCYRSLRVYLPLLLPCLSLLGMMKMCLNIL
jgi:hypothetical protein